MTFRAGTPPPLKIERLNADHDVSAFDCGDEVINNFLKVQALPEQDLGLSSVTVVCDQATPRTVIAYFTISPLSVKLDPRLMAALQIPTPPYPSVGGFLLGRLGVALQASGQGLGRSLVAVAVERLRKRRTETGGVFLAVDAKTDRLVSWYADLGFKQLGQGKRLVLRL